MLWLFVVVQDNNLPAVNNRKNEAQQQQKIDHNVSRIVITQLIGPTTTNRPNKSGNLQHKQWPNNNNKYEQWKFKSNKSPANNKKIAAAPTRSPTTNFEFNQQFVTWTKTDITGVVEHLLELNNLLEQHKFTTTSPTTTGENNKLNKNLEFVGELSTTSPKPPFIKRCYCPSCCCCLI